MNLVLEEDEVPNLIATFTKYKILKKKDSAMCKQSLIENFNSR